jgi:hypothetical protein
LKIFCKLSPTIYNNCLEPIRFVLLLYDSILITKIGQ